MVERLTRDSLSTNSFSGMFTARMSRGTRKTVLNKVHSLFICPSYYQVHPHPRQAPAHTRSPASGQYDISIAVSDRLPMTIYEITTISTHLIKEDEKHDIIPVSVVNHDHHMPERSHTGNKPGDARKAS